MQASRTFAWYSIAFAVFHFTVEMIYHFRYGQPPMSLIVDFIAVSLLLFGAYVRLVKGWNPGVLCGAWGFEFCLTYRSFFWRWEEIQAGTATSLTTNTAYGLGILLVIAAISFAYSVWLCRPMSKSAL